MPRIESKTDVSQVIKYLRSKRRSLSRGPQEDLILRNTARDVSALNPAHRIFYFHAVNDGRVAIKALENKTNNFPELHFKVSGTQWVVVESVGPSRPLRITDHAEPKVKAEIHKTTAEFFASLGGLPSTRDFITLRKILARKIIAIYKAETLAATETDNTKQSFYGVESTPLAESFEVVEEK